MLQPDLGTALVFGSILLAMLFWAGTPLPTLFFLVSPVIGLFLSISVWLWGAYIVLLTLALAFLYKPYLSEGAAIMIANVVAGTIALPLWNKLEPYQKNRFLVFLDPSIDPRGAGYNLIQSRVAIGSGGMYGKGFLDGTQKRLAFLPEQHTDFIFAVIGEEWASIGVAPVLVAFTFIFWRLVRSRSVVGPVREPGALRPLRELVRARAGEHRDDGGDHADHRHPAPLPELRRLVPAGEPAGGGDRAANRAEARGGGSDAASHLNRMSVDRRTRSRAAPLRGGRSPGQFIRLIKNRTMAWFRKPKTKLQAGDKREMPGDVWEKCPSCGEILYREKLKENWNVCPQCAFHLRLPAAEYVNLLLDEGSWEEHDAELRSGDPLGFVDLKPYPERSRRRSGRRGAATR
jgi:hypothetical protein